MSAAARMTRWPTAVEPVNKRWSNGSRTTPATVASPSITASSAGSKRSWMRREGRRFRGSTPRAYDQDAISRGDGAGERAEREVERIIPGNDDAGDAEGLGAEFGSTGLEPEGDRATFGSHPTAEVAAGVLQCIEAGEQFEELSLVAGTIAEIAGDGAGEEIAFGADEGFEGGEPAFACVGVGERVAGRTRFVGRRTGRAEGRGPGSWPGGVRDAECDRREEWSMWAGKRTDLQAGEARGTAEGGAKGLGPGAGLMVVSQAWGHARRIHRENRAAGRDSGRRVAHTVDSRQPNPGTGAGGGGESDRHVRAVGVGTDGAAEAVRDRLRFCGCGGGGGVGGEAVSGGRPSVGSNQGLLGRQGTFAEQIAVDEVWAYPTPPAVTDEQAAAGALVGITAHLGLVREAGVQRGETVFVNGGSGGVGSTVIQLARALGARVFCTAGSDEKVKACLGLGAEAAFNYRTQDVVAEVKRLAPGGVQVWSGKPRGIRTSTGRWRCWGRAGGSSSWRDARHARLPVGPFYVKGCRLHGFVMFAASPDEQRVAAVDLNRWLGSGQYEHPSSTACCPWRRRRRRTSCRRTLP